jgi:hypothetical protein
LESKYKEKDIRGGKINRKIFVINFTIMALAMLVRRKYIMPKESNEKNLPPWRQKRKKLFNQHPEKHEIVVIGENTPLQNERIAMTPMAGVVIRTNSEKPSALNMMTLSFDLR